MRTSEADDAPGEVGAILRRAGLGTGPLTRADGVANDVWLTPEHVVRLSSGRLRRSMRHEAGVLTRLPPTIPHAGVIAVGDRAGVGEFLVLDRLPGVSLGTAWPALTTARRRRLAAELAGHVQALHRLDVTDWPDNPWVADALAGRYADAYHAPPGLAPALVEAARSVRPDAAAVLDRVADFLAHRVDCFAGDEARPVLVHADLHVDNVMVAVEESGPADRLTGLIDFEGSRVAAPDVELDMLLRSVRTAAARGVEDVERLPGWLLEGYPELVSHPRIVDRLEAYELLWHLVQLHHWRLGVRWMADPVTGLTGVLDGGFVREVTALIAR